MKKVLILGAGIDQVPIIRKAREMGHYVIVCDLVFGNPGQKYAHQFFNTSATDKEGVLDLARSLNIDGIVCYSSDLTAPVAAYVAEKLNLPTHPYNSVEILSKKDLFRNFLASHNFNTPKARGYESLEDAKVDFSKYKLPVMVKPVDSYGSKGVSKIDSFELLKENVENALKYSKVKRFLIEEYIDSNRYYHIGGEGFSVNGELIFTCYFNEHFPKSTPNRFVPIGMSYPCLVPSYLQKKIDNEIQRVLDLLCMKTGAYNFEIRIDDNDNVYLIEIAARNGGGYQSILKNTTGFKLDENIINASIGEDCDLFREESKEYWANFALYSNKDGTFKEAFFHYEFIENIMTNFELFFKPGDKISALISAQNLLGIMELRFSFKEDMYHFIENYEEFVEVTISEATHQKSLEFTNNSLGDV